MDGTSGCSTGTHPKETPMPQKLEFSPKHRPDSSRSGSTPAAAHTPRDQGVRGYLVRVLRAMGWGRMPAQRCRAIANQYERAGRHAEAAAMREAATSLEPDRV